MKGNVIYDDGRVVKKTVKIFIAIIIAIPLADVIYLFTKSWIASVISLLVFSVVFILVIKDKKIETKPTFELYSDGIHLVKDNLFFSFDDIDRVHLHDKEARVVMSIICGGKVTMLGTDVRKQNVDMLSHELQLKGVKIERDLKFLKKYSKDKKQ